LSCGEANGETPDLTRAASSAGIRRRRPGDVILTGTPAGLRQALGSSGVDVLELRPGETAE
jgi:2-keto-4-pentenoate hydratase/2-oxohepta-3-ene-1,7-dioic acid hydratase in catechol pathway